MSDMATPSNISQPTESERSDRSLLDRLFSLFSRNRLAESRHTAGRGYGTWETMPWKG